MNMRRACSATHAGRFLSTVPLFRGLSKEVVSALCKICRPLIAMKSQVE